MSITLASSSIETFKALSYIRFVGFTRHIPIEISSLDLDDLRMYVYWIAQFVWNGGKKVDTFRCIKLMDEWLKLLHLARQGIRICCVKCKSFVPKELFNWSTCQWSLYVFVCHFYEFRPLKFPIILTSKIRVLLINIVKVRKFIFEFRIQRLF